jgi:hypothetical protein
MTDEDAPARDAAEALTPGSRDWFHIPVAPDGSSAIPRESLAESAEARS